MARPIKYGLDYWSCDVDIFDDEKIRPISGEFGIKGQIALIHLLCAIYRNGYFILWTDRLKYTLCDKMPGINEELLEMIVNRLVKWGFFDENLFNSVKVLTSKAIQERYFSAVYRRQVIETDEYLLIPLPKGFCCQKQQEKSEKRGFCQHNDNNNTPADGFLLSKTPKVNKIKEKEISTNVDTKKVPEGLSLPESPKTARKRFEKPTIEEITAYCKERGNGIDALSFFDYYESKGWVIGKSPMKDWKAAVRNWERMDNYMPHKGPPKGNPPRDPTRPQKIIRSIDDL